MTISEKVSQEDSGIYKIVNKFNNKIYIGSSINLNRRLKDHIYHLIKNNHHSLLLQRSWNKYGFEYFDIEILEFCDKNRLQEREQYYLDLYKSYNPNFGYNISKDTSSFSRGMKHSDEWKRLQSKRMIGHQNYLQYHTEETKQKIREKSLRRQFSNETREKLSKSLIGNRNGSKTKGYKRTQAQIENHINKISKLYVGLISPDGVVYKDIFNLSNFCKEHNLPISSINFLARGIRKECKGWKLWEFQNV